MTSQAVDISANTQVRNLQNPGRTFNEAWITWEMPLDSSYLIGYDVRWGGGASLYTPARECIVPGLTPEVEYRIEVQPRRSQGTPAQVASIRVVTHDRVPPTQPRGLQRESLPGNRSMLSWDMSQDNVGVTGYLLQWNGETERLVTPSAYVVDLPVQQIKSWQVSARDAAGNRSRITRWNSGVPPSKPTDLRASSVTGNSVTLEWVASTDDIAVVGYQIYCDNRLVDIDTTGNNRFTVTDLDELTTYTFKVGAWDTDGHLTFSDVLTVTTSDATAPSRPTRLRATRITGGTVDLTWDPSFDNVEVTGYRIYRNNVPIDTVSTTYYTAGGLTDATSYTFRVRALDADENFADSDPLTITTVDVTAPSKPTDFRASVVSANTVFLRWDESVDNVGVIGYQLLRDNVSIEIVTTSYYFAKELSEGATYLFKVRALDAAGNHTDSDSVSVTVPDETRPSKPGNLRASTITGHSVALEWDASADNVGVTGYRIWRNNTAIDFVSNTRYVAGGLSQLTSYEFKVSALDAAENATDSDSLTVRTRDGSPPSKPTNLRIVIISSLKMLRWDPSTDNIAVTGYEVYRNNVYIDTTPYTYYVGLDWTPPYVLRVRALDADGNFTDSDPLTDEMLQGRQ
ncbi:hypothetical protein C1886_23045 [Pseudomonas sp. FW300-N1A1]|uniref:fibronectin type III domain-containing protein n=1 Tax=Pseudomonas sp. FW300-N1A1 TaxID=2075555 RepID=UPI000CD14384|nr:fibronectin type III domain-containing protein [Pseudomonas sp. FW300-N1A1]POA17233.1 hypothetical protein C1886_23045 [Pseudomonas sp. FW300-N1A1]